MYIRKIISVFNSRLLILLTIYCLTIFIFIYCYYFIREGFIELNEIDNLEDWTKNTESCITLQNCQFSKNKINNIFIGDSHAMQLYVGYRERNIQSTLLFGELMRGEWFVESNYNPRLAMIEKYLDKANPSDNIFFSIAQHQIFIRGYRKIDNRQALKTIIKELILIANNKKLNFYLVNDTPRLSIDLPISICMKQIEESGFSDCDIPKNEALIQRQILTTLFDEISMDLGVKILDPFHIVCSYEVCSPILGNKQIFIDQNHISKTIAKEVASYLSSKT